MGKSRRGLTLLELIMQEMDISQVISANTCKISVVPQGSKERNTVLV